MHLVTLCTPTDPAPRAGLVFQDGIHLLPAGVRAIDVVRNEADYVVEATPVDPADATLYPPILPGKIIAIGKNYADHATEMAATVPDHPLIFAVLPSAVTATNTAIQWRQAITTEVDYEGELAVVIGQRCKDVSRANALDVVFGYTIANDVTARDLQKRIDKQWTRGKSLDTFCPLGPHIVTRADIPDPHNLSVRTTLNGTVMQDGNTRDMIFDVPHLVSYCSQMFTLEPGDIILTGTPAGVGAARTPPVFMTHGDTVSVEIEGIGTLTNTCEVLDASHD